MGYDGGITEERDVKTLAGFAEAALGTYRIVQAGTSGNQVKAATLGSQYPLGVSGDASEVGKASYEADDPVAVKYSGIVYVSMSGTGSRHDRVRATTAGQGIKHNNTDDVYIFGNAMQDWTANQVIPVLVDRYYIGDYTNT